MNPIYNVGLHPLSRRRQYRFQGMIKLRISVLNELQEARVERAIRPCCRSSKRPTSPLYGKRRQNGVKKSKISSSFGSALCFATLFGTLDVHAKHVPIVIARVEPCLPTLNLAKCVAPREGRNSNGFKIFDAVLTVLPIEWIWGPSAGNPWEYG
jgi:hypothetical protein